MIKKIIKKILSKNTTIYNKIRNLYWFIRNRNPILTIKKKIIKSQFKDDKIYLNIGGFIFKKRLESP